MGDIKQQNKEEGQQSLFQERSLMNEVYPPYGLFIKSHLQIVNL
jgi:hypothetical protein